ncbi:MAG: FHA domain-containing protein [Vicinamibacteria bacterium]|nr:FHA domain-containing protein [Vicinamibacteria bacterium]
MSGPAPRAFLRFRLPGEAPRTQVLEHEETTLGRDRAADLCLPYETISRLHARIAWDGRRHLVEDLGSANGTRVNGRLARRQRLRDLDVVSLATDVDLLFLTGRSAERIELEGVVDAWLEPADGGERVAVPPGELTLGRAASANHVVESPAVSKLHARIERHPTAVFVEDLGSSNGTELNDRVVARARLRDGDEIALAGTARYRVRIVSGKVATTAATVPSEPAAAADDADVTIVRRFDADWRAKLEAAGEELAAAAEREPADDPRPIAVVRLEGGGRYVVVTEPGEHEIGRSAALRLEHPTVSRRHARLTLSADRRTATLADLGASYPARVEGRPVSGETALRHGDRVEFGDVVLTVRFVRG